MRDVSIIFILRILDQVEITDSKPGPRDGVVYSDEFIKELKLARVIMRAIDIVRNHGGALPIGSRRAVMEKVRTEMLSTAKSVLRQIRRTPSLVPAASREICESKEGPAISRVKASEKDANLDSCRQTIDGFILSITSLTAARLVASFNPLTFQLNR